MALRTKTCKKKLLLVINNSVSLHLLFGHDFWPSSRFLIVIFPFPAQVVIDPNEPHEYCPVCAKHLDDEAFIDGETYGNDDKFSVMCLSECQVMMSFKFENIFVWEFEAFSFL